MVRGSTGATTHRPTPARPALASEPTIFKVARVLCEVKTIKSLLRVLAPMRVRTWHPAIPSRVDCAGKGAFRVREGLSAFAACSACAADCAHWPRTRIVR